MRLLKSEGDNIISVFYRVEAVCPPRLAGKALLFRFAMRADKEIFEITNVINKLCLHVAMVSACTIANYRDEYFHIKPCAPILTYDRDDR